MFCANFRHALWFPLITWLFVFIYQKQISAQHVLSFESLRAIQLRLLLFSAGLLRKKVLVSIKKYYRLHTKGNVLWCSYLSWGTCKTCSFFMVLKYFMLILNYVSTKWPYSLYFLKKKRKVFEETIRLTHFTTQAATGYSHFRLLPVNQQRSMDFLCPQLKTSMKNMNHYFLNATAAH